MVQKENFSAILLYFIVFAGFMAFYLVSDNFSFDFDIGEAVSDVASGAEDVGKTISEEASASGDTLGGTVTSQVKPATGLIEAFDLENDAINVRNTSTFSVDITSVVVGGVLYDCEGLSIPPNEVRVITGSVCEGLSLRENKVVTISGSNSFKVDGII